MKSARTLLIATGIVAGLLIFRSLTAPSDEDRIRDGLAESIKASSEGRSGGVLEYLSNKIRVNETEYRFYQRDLGATIRKLKPYVTVLKQEPVINGDVATIVSPVTLKLSVPKFEITIPDVTITFKREQARDWVVIPSHRWRVTGVDIPPDALQDLSLPFG